jgi:hypothetical protein
LGILGFTKFTPADPTLKEFFREARVLELPQPGKSLHPSSPPVSRLSSPKPLPTQSWPLRPVEASLGPKAAGLAAKDVLLSSVKLMAALGGKRENGVL